MAKKENKEEKQKFGDIIENHDLIKRTLMVAAYPALIKSVKKDDGTFFEGFLPGFEFATVEDIETEDECVEFLQDALDDEVEELVVFGKSLPNVDEDEKLLKDYPDHKIVYLDINVYATKEELDYYDSCDHNCEGCAHKCGEDEFYDEEFIDYCQCGCEDGTHSDNCFCDADCDCDDNDDCDDNCSCGGDDSCCCNNDAESNKHCNCNNNHNCDCKDDNHKHKNHKENCNCKADKKGKNNCHSKK